MRVWIKCLVFVACALMMCVFLFLATITPAKYSQSRLVAIWGNERLVDINSVRIKTLTYRLGSVVADSVSDSSMSSLLEKHRVSTEGEASWRIYSSSGLFIHNPPNYNKGMAAFECLSRARFYIDLLKLGPEQERVLLDSFVFKFRQGDYDAAFSAIIKYGEKDMRWDDYSGNGVIAPR